MATAIAEQAERAFAGTFLNTIGSQPVHYADDYQQPVHLSLKRVPVLPLPVPPPPTLRQAPPTAASLQLVFKSLKPPASFTLTVHPTDTVQQIKAQLAAAHPSAPPPDQQRLLIKGKALADPKLLKEYTINDGDTVNLLVKPGFAWDPNATPAPPMADSSPVPAPKPSFGSGSLDPHAKPKGRHQRIPSVVLSPSPSTETPGLVEKDIILTLDQGALPSPVAQPEVLSTYHETVSKPEFWEKLYAFLKQEFTNEADVHLAFEDFLCACKGSLTASEIAKIRDTVGIIGMAGT